MTELFSSLKDVIGGTVIPLGLIGIGLLMGWFEVRSYKRAQEHSIALPRARLRLFRRLLGCISIAGIGGLVFLWMHQVRPLTARGGPSDLAVSIMFGCLGLVLLAIILAVWDAIDGISSLKKVVDEMHSKDLSDLEAALRSHERHMRN